MIFKTLIVQLQKNCGVKLDPNHEFCINPVNNTKQKHFLGEYFFNYFLDSTIIKVHLLLDLTILSVV